MSRLQKNSMILQNPYKEFLYFLFGWIIFKGMKTILLSSLNCPCELPICIRDTYQDESAEPHTHDYIEIAMVRKGRGLNRNHFPDGRIISNSIIKGDVFTILPGEVHSYTQCYGYRVYNLCVASSFLESSYEELKKLEYFEAFFGSRQASQINQLHLSPAGFGAAEGKLRGLSMALQSGRASRDLAVKIALLDYLMTVFDGDFKDWARRGSEINERLFQSIARLEAHPEKKFELAEIAHDAGMSISGYSHKFKQAIGVPPGDYCLFLRLDTVKRMLEECDRSLEEIAFSCGFCDSNYMIRLFKKRFGMPPGHYRAQYRLDKLTLPKIRPGATFSRDM